jgi:hypothetical protein
MPVPNDLQRIIPVVQWLNAQYVEATYPQDCQKKNWSFPFDEATGFRKGIVSGDLFFAFPAACEKAHQTAVFTIHYFGNEWMIKSEIATPFAEGRVRHVITAERLHAQTDFLYQLLHSVHRDWRVRHPTEFSKDG